jgi:hypothetical protein
MHLRQGDMDENYLPVSDFLRAVISDEVPLSGGDYGADNIRRLIEMMRDDDRTNRDWATLLLSQQDIDTVEVRAALIAAASDDDRAVRAEAILGITQRDRAVALPFIQAALAEHIVLPPIFEAALLTADPSLIADLQCFTEDSENSHADQLARDALAACEKSQAGR